MHMTFKIGKVSIYMANIVNQQQISLVSPWLA